MSELLLAALIVFALGFLAGIKWAKIRSNQRWAKVLDDAAEEEQQVSEEPPP